MSTFGGYDSLVEEILDFHPEERAMEHRRNSVIARQIRSNERNALILCWDTFDDVFHFGVSRILSHEQISTRVRRYVWK
jgi:hypothetical protein